MPGVERMFGSDAVMGDDGTVLECLGLAKRFGGTVALDAVDLKVHAGEVHALLGHNGSGKSTLVKSIVGYHRPDQGIVRVRGHTVSYPTNALQLAAYGLGVLHQDIGLVDSLSILENVRVGRLRIGRWSRKIRWRYEKDALQAILSSYGLMRDSDTIVGMLAPSERVVVGMLRALEMMAFGRGVGGCLILDEPTASLGISEVDAVLDTVRRVAREGDGVLLIAHSPEEVLSVADRVTVLRDGIVKFTGPCAELTVKQLANVIAGESVLEGGERDSQLGRRVNDAVTGSGKKVVMELKAAETGTLRGCDIELYSGEVLGIAGISGSGYDEIPRVMFGVSKPKSGEVFLEGVRFRKVAPANLVRGGVGFVSGDRIREGGALGASVGENAVLPFVRSLRTKMGRVSGKAEKREVDAILGMGGVRYGSIHGSLSTLSGGNQQKVLICRWIGHGTKVLLTCEPTAGIDVGSVAQIYEVLKGFAGRGGAVLVASAQVDELVQHCHRVIVIRNGRPIREFLSAEMNAADVTRACYA